MKSSGYTQTAYSVCPVRTRTNAKCKDRSRSGAGTDADRTKNVQVLRASARVPEEQSRVRPRSRYQRIKCSRPSRASTTGITNRPP